MATRVWTLLLMLCCLGFVQAPRPCAGDGHGQACSATACACMTACTCQEAHRAVRKLAAALCAATDACQTDVERLAACETVLAACHGDEAPRHFAPGPDGDPALLGAAPAALALGPARVAALPPADRASALPPPPRGRPPWILG
jgi:hypothetical protein